MDRGTPIQDLTDRHADGTARCWQLQPPPGRMAARRGLAGWVLMAGTRRLARQSQATLSPADGCLWLRAPVCRAGHRRARNLTDMEHGPIDTVIETRTFDELIVEETLHIPNRDAARHRPVRHRRRRRESHPRRSRLCGYGPVPRLVGSRADLGCARHEAEGTGNDLSQRGQHLCTEGQSKFSASDDPASRRILSRTRALPDGQAIRPQ